MTNFLTVLSLFLAFSLVGAAQNLATFTHPHLGTGQVQLTGSLAPR